MFSSSENYIDANIFFEDFSRSRSSNANSTTILPIVSDKIEEKNEKNEKVEFEKREEKKEDFEIEKEVFSSSCLSEVIDSVSRLS